MSFVGSMLSVDKYIYILLLLIIVFGCPPASGHNKSEDPFKELVQPFLRQHCFSCHNQEKAKAGLRLDLLKENFLDGKNGEIWKEVSDRINLGEMPPKKEPRPDSEHSFKVIEWIAEELNRLEKEANLAGGRIPMRRLNKREYANTIRDLLYIDEKLIAPIVEELPGDGKAEGFDRLGIGLFFDSTQIDRYLKAAERISELAIVNASPPPKHELIWQPEESMEKLEYWTEYSMYSGKEGHKVKVGAHANEFKKDGVQWIAGLDVRDEAQKDNPWERMAWLNPNLDDIVTQDGWYRIQVRAGAHQGKRSQSVRLRLDYAYGTPIQAHTEIEITSKIHAPEVFEVSMFLRRGPDGVQRRLEPWWNPTKGMIDQTEEHHRHLVAVLNLEEEITEGIERQSDPEELDKLRKKLKEARKKAEKFKGPIQEFKFSTHQAPKIFLDWIKVDGPYPSSTVAQKPKVTPHRFEAEKQRSGGMGIRPPRKTENNRFVVDAKVEVEAGAPRYEIQKEGVLFVQGGDTYQRGNPYGRLATVSLDELIPEDGYYRIRIRGGASRGTRDEPIELLLSYNFKTPQEKNESISISATHDEPGVFEAVMFLRRGADDQRRKLTLLYNDLRKYIVSTPEFNKLFQDTIGTVGKIQKARTRGDAAEVKRLEAFLVKARKRAREWPGPVRYINPEFEDVEPPKFYLDWLEFEGPLQEEWPPKSHRYLLYDGDDRHDKKYVRRIFEKFLPRAYRRPVSAIEIDGVAQLVLSELETTKDFHGALRLGLQRVLTSPGFLFLQEPGGAETRQRRALTAHELATRLSFYLWSSMPDAELLTLAKNGTLLHDEVLRTQVDRLLKDPKAREFVLSFGGQWLSVPEFGSIMPAAEYRDYDFELEEATKLEAYGFFEEVLRKNLPITTFLDSDFVMVNERLARHYGIEGIKGKEIRRVAIRPEHHRGGVLGMAGLMTLLSDGTRTLPVRRGTWIVSQLFNRPPPPPPPNAGEVQPNTAGEKLTVRERLQRHRDEPTCASCHRRLDPFGLALENYDAIGKWRTRQNGEDFRGSRTPLLDVSGELPSGNKFQTLEEFKALLLKEADSFAHAFTEKMLTYALSRPVGFRDSETLNKLVNELKGNEFRIHSLIHAIVQSRVFRTK